MSDAQSILLILIFFYSIECLKWVPLGAVAIVRGAFSPFRWQVQLPTVKFFGMRKSLFVAPILPALQLQLITDKTGDGGHQHSQVKSAVGVRRRLFQLQRRTRSLRTISACTFATYFILLPALYLNYGLGSYVYSTVGLGYVLQSCAAISYFRGHRFFFPAERGLRYLHSFYNCLLPWHAMRASDELFIKSAESWSELAILAATYNENEHDHRLALYWRQAQLVEQSSYSATVLAPILAEVGLSPELAMQAIFPEDEGQVYCPCCGVIYRSDVKACVDCRGLKLRQS